MDIFSKQHLSKFLSEVQDKCTLHCVRKCKEEQYCLTYYSTKTSSEKKPGKDEIKTSHIKGSAPAWPQP